MALIKEVLDSFKKDDCEFVLELTKRSDGKPCFRPYEVLCIKTYGTDNEEVRWGVNFQTEVAARTELNRWR